MNSIFDKMINDPNSSWNRMERNIQKVRDKGDTLQSVQKDFPIGKSFICRGDEAYGHVGIVVGHMFYDGVPTIDLEFKKLNTTLHYFANELEAIPQS